MGYRRSRATTAVEILVVLAILAVIAVAVFVPIINKARHSPSRDQAWQAGCNSNIRQLALAIQMYVQDNGGQYPGIDGSSWVSKIAPYLGSSSQMFMCPGDATRDSGGVSYAYSSLLIRKDGSGVKEAAVISPSEVGCVVDATPTENYPNGRLIGGGGQQPIETVGATIQYRHNYGEIVGFCDGHAKYYQGQIDLMDEGAGAVRAFYHVSPFGLVDNPLAGIGPGTDIAGSGTLTVGGEYAARPLLLAAAQLYGTYKAPGFNGQNAVAGRPRQNWAWGTISGAKGPSSPAVAYDALLFIVSKGSRIPSLPTLSNWTYLMPGGFLRDAFSQGCVANSVQVYCMSGNTGTDAYARTIARVKRYGKGALEVKNDQEMVEKVANDPYGIGYCSSLYADPDRVVILGFAGLGSDGNDAVWPRASAKFRWVLPPRAESNWPWKRSIDLATSKAPTALEKNVAGTLRGGALYKSLEQGPLFTYGYWAGDY